MANEANNFQELISHCKEYGYIFQSSELYDGLSAVYDYGQMGAQLKKNLRDEWWKSMTQLNEILWALTLLFLCILWCGRQVDTLIISATR